MMTKTSSHAVAQGFLDYASAKGEKLTNSRLQRLTIIAHGVHLARFQEPLFYEYVRAWDFGPVVPELYDRLRHHGKDNVPHDSFAKERGILHEHPNASQSIRATWEAYQGHETQMLGRFLTIHDGPWDKVWNQLGRKYSDIPNGLFREYYLPMIKSRQ